MENRSVSGMLQLQLQSAVGLGSGGYRSKHQDHRDKTSCSEKLMVREGWMRPPAEMMSCRRDGGRIAGLRL